MPMNPKPSTLAITQPLDHALAAPAPAGHEWPHAPGALNLRGVARLVKWNSQATRQVGETESEDVAVSHSESSGEAYQEGLSKRGLLFGRTTLSDSRTTSHGTSTTHTTSRGRAHSRDDTTYVLTLNFKLEVTWPDGGLSWLLVEVQARDVNLATSPLRLNTLDDGETVLIDGGHYNSRGVIEPGAIHNLTTGAVVYEATGARLAPPFPPARLPGALPGIHALQREELAGPALIPGDAPLIRLDIPRLRLARVLGVRDFWEESAAGTAALGDAARSALVGLHSGGEPALHVLTGGPNGIALYAGAAPLVPPPPPPPTIRLSLPPPPAPPPPLPPRRARSPLLLIPATTAGAVALAVAGHLAPLDGGLLAAGFGGLAGLGLLALGRGLRPPAPPPVAVVPAPAAVTVALEPAPAVAPAETPPAAPPEPPDGPPEVARAARLVATLRAVYPEVELAPQTAAQVAHLRAALAAMPFAGLVVGTPAGREPGAAPMGLPLEQLVRGLRGGGPWAVVTIALPVAEAEARALREAALRERQALADAAQAGAPAVATAQHYGELLEQYGRKLERGRQGLWHVGVAFLAADETTFHILAGRLRAFGGPEAAPDPLRVLPLSGGLPGIAELALPATPGPPAEGHVRYAYRWLSLLATGELATWTRLPAEEAPGYAVKRHAEFGKTTGRGPATGAPSLGRVRE